MNKKHKDVTEGHRDRNCKKFSISKEHPIIRSYCYCCNSYQNASCKAWNEETGYLPVCKECLNAISKHSHQKHPLVTDENHD